MKGTTKTPVRSRLLSVLLSVMMILSLLPVDLAFAETGKKTGWAGVPDGEVLVKDTVTHISDGVTSREIICNVPTGDRQQIDYIAEIEPRDTLKVVSGYGHDDASKWSLTPTTVQAKAYEENHPGETVIAAINADFFNMATGQPMGALVMNGTEYNAANGRAYFGITKDGKAVVRNTPDLSDLQTAVGGDAILVQDGKIVVNSSEYGDIRYSRTAVGVKADGTIMTFVTYGRRAPISYGRTYYELAQMMQRGGCVAALALDGGGSSTFCSRPEGTDKLEVRNTPTDGAEREVSSSLLVVSTTQATGVFDHAVLSPNNEVYTPGTQVQFSAVGVDTAGKSVALPEGVSYALSEGCENMGTMDAVTGLLTTNEACGTLGVDMLLDGKVVGTTTIEVATPDQIYFANEEISLGFEETTDFGLVVRSQGRDIHIKSGDILWSITDVKTASGEAAAAEDMGTFDGNSFTSSDGKTLNGNVNAVSKWDESVKGSIHAIVGMLPTVVWDFEDHVDAETGAVTPASDYYVGDSGILTTRNYGRGGKQSIEIVSIDDDEPVRFGSKALKLNYDFRDCGAVTEGACIGTTTGMQISGTPTAIGAWVYAPEGVGITYDPSVSSQAGFWLRGYVKDGAGNNMAYDFTLEPKSCVKEDGSWNGVQPGIYWEGWQYVEADLTKLTPPYSIQPGMTFRLMYVAGTNMGTKSAGSIYFDNFQFVYGANVDDTDAPVVDSITVNGTELKNDAVIEDAKLKIDAIFHDVENKYTTGIDKDTIRMYIDDVNVVNNDRYQYAVEPDGTMSHLYDLELENGQHTVTVSLRDGFGNETTETRTFTVKKAAPAATVQVAALEKTAILGKTVDIQILASDATVTENTTVLKLDNLFPDYEVIFADGYEGSYSFSKLSKKLTVKTALKDGAQPASGDNGCLMATVRVQIPATLNESSALSFTVKGGSFLTASGAYATYHQPEVRIPVGAEYTISAAPIIVSESGTGTLTVVNSKGEPAVGVSIYMDGTNELVGVTDQDGKLTTDRFGKAVGKYLVYAKDEAGLLSFRYSIGVYDIASQTLPYNVRFNAPKNETTEKNISWLSNPAVEGQQSIRYAVSGSDNWVTVAANTTQMTFTEGGYITANFSNITLTGLSAGTTYDYQVGCGELWTDVATFSTSDGETDHADFFVLGDIQADDLTNITTIRDTLKGGHWNFGIQTGDAVDNPRTYKGWDEYTGLFNGSTMGSTNMVQVLGNHELQGEALESKAMFGLDASYGGSCYSRTYGNVYLAVINYTGNAAQLRTALDWLKKDAQASTADWKILTMHQPAYYTNNSGGNAEINALVPSAAEEAGIDVVFSGHDHSLARTNPLRGGERDDDNGILYYICGSSGEKSYSITTRDVFDYDKVFAVATLDFNAIYLTAHADADKLTINVYDVGKDEPIDTYTLESDCFKNGHTYQLDTAAKQAVCTVCHRANETFTGDILDADGNEYYMLSGTLQSGWVSIGTEVRYYHPDTCIREKVTETETASTCIFRGYVDYTSASGATKRVNNPRPGGHDYKLNEAGQSVCATCGHVRVNMQDVTVKLSTTAYTYNGRKHTPSTTAYAPDGTQLIKKSVDGSVYDPYAYYDYYSTYSNNVEVGTATVRLNAYKFAYYVDINDYHGNCAGYIDVNYEIRPDLPTDVKAEVKGDQVVLTWTAALCQPEYVIYRTMDGRSYDELGVTDQTSITLPLAETMGYRLRIGTRKLGTDNQMHTSTYKTSSITVCPVVTGSVAPETGYPVLKWKPLYNAAEYEIYRAASADGDFSKIAQVSAYSFADINVERGTEYFYAVRAINKDGSLSAFSPAVGLIPGCEVPQIDSRSDAVTGDPVISWKAVAGAERYEVYRAGTRNGTYKLIATTDGTSYADAAATTGYTYFYKVKALDANESANSGFSAVVSAVSRCAQTEVKLGTNSTTGKPVISWTAVDGAKQYEVYRAGTRNGSYKLLGTTDKLSYTDNTASTGYIYFYKVVAVSKVRTSANSEASTVISAASRCAQTEVKSGTNSTTGKPVISWTAVSGAKQYEVYRAGTRNGSYKLLGTTDKLSYTDNTASTGYIYFYKVVAVSKVRTSANSEASTVISAVSRCAQTVAKSSFNSTTGKPVISWTAVSGAKKYEVYRAGTRNGSYKLLGTTDKLSYTDNTASAGYTYFYKVVAVSKVRAAANSEASAVISAVSHCAKPAVTASFNSKGQPHLQWTAVPGAARYEIYRATSKDGEYKLMYSVKGTSYSNTSAKSGKTYYYKVKAVSKVRSNADSVFSAVMRVTAK